MVGCADNARGAGHSVEREQTAGVRVAGKVQIVSGHICWRSCGRCERWRMDTGQYEQQLLGLQSRVQYYAQKGEQN